MADKAIEAAIIAYQDYEGYDAVGMMKAAIQAYQAAQWQPIESAPKDKSILLLDKEAMHVGMWMKALNGGDEDWVFARGFNQEVGQIAMVCNPTRWQPLPLTRTEKED